MRNQPEAQLSLTLNDIRNLAAGQMQDESRSAEFAVAADLYNSLRDSSRKVLAGLVVALSFSGFALAWLQLRPQFRARNRVEAVVRFMLVLASLLAIVTVPLWLLLLGPHFARLETLNPATVAGVLAKSFLLPMLLGIAVRGIVPDASARLSDALLKAVGVVFSACALALLATHWQVVGAVLGPPILALGGFTFAALCIGHLFGGPDPATGAERGMPRSRRSGRGRW